MPRAGATAVVAAAMALASAAPGAAQADQSAEVLDLTLPVSELVLETSSLDRSYRRVESTEDVRLTLAADVLFAFGRADLSQRARDRLADAADEIRSLDPDAVTIVGHTDSKGSDSYNSGLSERRAQSVEDALTRWAATRRASRRAARARTSRSPPTPRSTARTAQRAARATGAWRSGSPSGERVKR